MPSMLGALLLVSACNREGGPTMPPDTPVPQEQSAPMGLPTEPSQGFPVVPRSPLVTSPCAPPCWQGIVPGISTEQDVRDLLEQRPDILSKCVEVDNEAQSGARGLACTGITFGFEQGGDLVDGIGIIPTEPVTLSEIIAMYGEPRLVLASEQGTPEEPWALITVYFEEPLMTVTFDKPDLDYSLTPESTATSVGYLSEAALAQNWYQMAVPWDGYGDYAENAIIP